MKTFREFVELGELNKKTLGSYIKKASKDVSDHDYDSDRGDGKKRLKGIARASNRLVKRIDTTDRAHHQAVKVDARETSKARRRRKSR